MPPSGTSGSVGAPGATPGATRYFRSRPVRTPLQPPDGPSLRGAVSEYAALKNKEARDELNAEREDVQRVALIRLFAGVEADFRGSLQRSWRVATSGLRPATSKGPCQTRSSSYSCSHRTSATAEEFAALESIIVAITG